jgi:hypothetical protein
MELARISDLSGSALKIQPAPPGMPFGVHIDVITSLAIWGYFFCPPGTLGPPVHPRGNFYQTDFPPLSCSVLRGSALLRPHPSGAPAGLLTPAGLHPQEVLPGRLPDKAHSNCHKKPSRHEASTITTRAARASPNLTSSPTKSREVT